MLEHLYTQVEGIQVHADEGGTTQTRGGIYWLILPAGCNFFVLCFSFLFLFLCACVWRVVVIPCEMSYFISEVFCLGFIVSIFLKIINYCCYQ